MNNFIALDNNDIITYNKIQSKIYKYFINHHKQYDFKFDIRQHFYFNFRIYVASKGNIFVNFVKAYF
jgi:hypothetical protein